MVNNTWYFGYFNTEQPRKQMFFGKTPDNKIPGFSPAKPRYFNPLL